MGTVSPVVTQSSASGVKELLNTPLTKRRVGIRTVFLNGVRTTTSGSAEYCSCATPFVMWLVDGLSKNGRNLAKSPLPRFIPYDER